MSVMTLPTAKTPADRLIGDVLSLHGAYTAGCRTLDNYCFDIVPDQYKEPVKSRAFPNMASDSGLTLDGLSIHFDRALTPLEQARIPSEIPLVLNGKTYGAARVIVQPYVSAPR